MKLKLNVGGMKQFFVAHGEKIGFGVVGLICLLLIVSAIKRERLDASKSPDRLRDESQRALQKVNESQWSPESAELEMVDFRARASRQDVVPQQYALHTEINPSIWPPMKKRGAPEFYPIEDLRVAYGAGTFALQAEPGELMMPVDTTSTKTRPKPAPKPKEPATAAGGSRFAPGGVGGAGGRPPVPAGGPAGGSRFSVGKQPPSRFAPGGIGEAGGRASRRPTMMFQGQTPGFPALNNKLKPQRWVVVTGLIPVKKQQAEYDRAFEGSQGGEHSQMSERPEYDSFEIERAVVESNDQKDLQWEVLDLEKCFEFEEGWAGQAPSDLAPAECRLEPFTAPLGPLVGVDWDESVTHPKLASMPRSATGAAGGFAGGGGSRFSTPSGGAGSRFSVPAAGGSRFSVGGGGGSRFSPGGGAPTGQKRSSKRSKDAQEAAPYDPQQLQLDYYLFRFFDYTVQPDTRYRYRVKMKIANPNYRFEPRFLEKPDTRTEDYISTVSEPTSLVAVAKRASRVFVGPPKESSAEPNVKVVASVPSPYGFEIATSIEAQRGTLLNTTEKEFQAPNPALQDQSLVDFDKPVEFQTDAVVLDIRGGEVLSKDRDTDEELTAPGRVLLLDSLGRLIVRDELDDLGMYAAFEQQEMAKEAANERNNEPAPPLQPGAQGEGRRRGTQAPASRFSVP